MLGNLVPFVAPVRVQLSAVSCHLLPSELWWTCSWKPWRSLFLACLCAPVEKRWLNRSWKSAWWYRSVLPKLTFGILPYSALATGPSLPLGFLLARLQLLLHLQQLDRQPCYSFSVCRKVSNPWHSFLPAPRWSFIWGIRKFNPTTYYRIQKADVEAIQTSSLTDRF